MKLDKDYIVKIQLFYKCLMKELSNNEKDLLEEDISYDKEKSIEAEIGILNEVIERYENIFGEMLFKDA